MKTLTIVGLGNAQPRYQWSRHQAGFMVLECCARALQVEFEPDRELQCLLAVYRSTEITLRLAKPQTDTINESGLAVRALMHGSDPAELLVVHDDVSLDTGRLRFAFNGSAGGHHGVEDIINALQTRAFARLKVGLGPSPRGDERYRYVTEPLPGELRPGFLSCVEMAAQALPTWYVQGVEAAMNKWNSFRPGPV